MADGTLTQAEETLLREFRVRYDRIVDFEPFSDGFGIMRDAQTATPQSFRTGDGDETRKRVKMLADAGELRVVEGKILPPKIGGMVGGLLLSLAKGGQGPASACCSRRALPNEINQLCRRRGPARRDGNAAKLAFPPLPLASRSHAKPLLGPSRLGGWGPPGPGMRPCAAQDAIQMPSKSRVRRQNTLLGG